MLLLALTQKSNWPNLTQSADLGMLWSGLIFYFNFFTLYVTDLSFQV